MPNNTLQGFFMTLQCSKSSMYTAAVSCIAMCQHCSTAQREHYRQLLRLVCPDICAAHVFIALQA